MPSTSNPPYGNVPANAPILQGQYGSQLVPFVNEELITLATGGATTDSTGYLLPAMSLILLVTAEIVTTITNITNWQVGDGSTAGRFSAVNTTLTAGEVIPKTSIPPVQIGTGVASATTGLWQLAAAKVRITITGSNPGAGKVRVTVYGLTLTPSTS